MKSKKHTRLTICIVLLAIIILSPLLFSRCTPVISWKYAIKRSGGHCYIDFHAGNERIDLYNGGCIIPARSLDYSSIEEMHRALKYGKFSDDDLDTIRYAFPLDKKKGFLIPDYEKLYTVDLPPELYIRWLDLWGDQYTFYIRQKENAAAKLDFSGKLTIWSKDDYEETISKLRASHSEQDTLTETETTVAGVFRTIQRRVETEQAVYYVIEKYRLESYQDQPTSETVPIEVEICGDTGEIGFSIHSYSINGSPDEEFLDSFRLIPYRPIWS